MQKFLDWALHAGKTQALTFNYLPLPQGVVTKIENAWGKTTKVRFGRLEPTREPVATVTDCYNLDLKNFMNIREHVRPKFEYSRTLSAAIFDVDGVLLASPHERACREAVGSFADPDRFTTAMYETHVAGKPRASGARAALEALGVPEAERQAVIYAENKQKRLEELISAGSVAAFPDALRFVRTIGALGWPMAVASSSKNANQMMRQIHVDTGRSLLDVFSVNVCGRDLRQGKPNPAIFLLAAAEMNVGPAHCLVVEDAPAGIEAARAGGMTALGVARLRDTSLLLAAGADLVVTSLDEIATDKLADGRLCGRSI